MSDGKSHDVGNGHAYLLARALRQGGKLSPYREERIACAFVELREHIKNDLLKVAKDWQVPASELRRRYEEVYPFVGTQGPDLLCLEQACEGLMVDLRSNIQTYAEHYGVPDDMLQTLLVNWLVSEEMTSERMPTRLIVPEEPPNEKQPGEQSCAPDKALVSQNEIPPDQIGPSRIEWPNPGDEQVLPT